MLISVRGPYGDLLPGQNYRVVSSGRDFEVVRRGGKLVHVPKHMITAPISQQEKYIWDETYQDIVNKDFGMGYEEDE